MTYAVIVTYSSRWQYLRIVIKALLNFPDLNIVIVDNASEYPLRANLSEFESPRISYQGSDNNKGSAWGYGKGIQYAILQNDCNYIWLLDDDNLPQEKCLENLMEQVKLKGEKMDSNAFMCLRSGRKYLTNVANGKSVEFYFPTANAFLGFDLFNLIKKIRLLVKRVSGRVQTTIRIPCAPYGGLFFHKSLIGLIGLPDERYFVYADDFDFTYRITKNHGSIWLVSSAIIDDLEESWQHKQKKKPFSPVFLSSTGNKIYYSTRNFVYFQNNSIVENKLLFQFNRMIYTIYLTLIAIISNRLAALRKFREAVNDGLSGNFDNNKYPLT